MGRGSVAGRLQALTCNLEALGSSLLSSHWMDLFMVQLSPVFKSLVMLIANWSASHQWNSRFLLMEQ